MRVAAAKRVWNNMGETIGKFFVLPVAEKKQDAFFAWKKICTRIRICSKGQRLSWVKSITSRGSFYDGSMLISFLQFVVIILNS